MKQFLLAIFALFLTSTMFAQDITGKWKTIDDETGKMKSIVELSVKDGKLYGTVITLANPADKNKVCIECTDHRKGQKIIGMEIINGLEKEGNVWEGDDGIIDPENGKLYDCKIWVEDGELQVRGYIGFLFRTQIWIKA